MVGDLWVVLRGQRGVLRGADCRTDESIGTEQGTETKDRPHLRSIGFHLGKGG